MGEMTKIGEMTKNGWNDQNWLWNKATEVRRGWALTERSPKAVATRGARGGVTRANLAGQHPIVAIFP